MQTDVLVFSPHPDDAELYCGGTILSLLASGFRVGIIDVTRGELSTRGNLRTRAAETRSASNALGISLRENLRIPDGNVENSTANRLRAIRVVRKHRPSTILLPYPSDRHPDHGNTSTLVREASFQSGLSNIASIDRGIPQSAFRPDRAFYYMLTDDFRPTLIVDISAAFERKMDAIRCYRSQFHTGGDATNGPQTFISTPDFMESLVARSRRLGFLIGGKYGEGFEPVQAFGVSASALVTSRPS
jgi:N-acetylglucosamine malate deacetylase 1